MTGLAELLADCDAQGIRLIPTGDKGLTVDAPQGALTPDLMERVKTHKRELLAVLDSDLAASVSDSDPWEQCIEPPDPCPQCGTLELWQTLVGNWRCMACDPPKTAMRALEAAEKIRRRHGIRSPPGVTEMLATQKQ